MPASLYLGAAREALLAGAHAHSPADELRCRALLGLHELATLDLACARLGEAAIAGQLESAAQASSAGAARAGRNPAAKGML